MSPEYIQSVIKSNEVLRSEADSLKAQVNVLQSQLDYLKRRLFGKTSERFIADKNQLTLSDDWGTTEEEEDERESEKITYERKKSRKPGSGRQEIPDDIPRKIIRLEPNLDTTGMVKIDEKVTEQLEYKPAEFYATKYVRPVYMDDSTGMRKIFCAELPALCIPKGKAGPSLVAHTLVAKCEDHMPLFRIVKQVNRDCGIRLPESSTLDWFNVGCFWIVALVRRMEEIIMSSGYVQIDESFLKVMIKPTGGKSTQGYMWVRYSPELKIAAFHFDRKRNGKVARELIGDDFEGVVQSDGLVVYDFLDDRPKIKHAGCNGHARRGFEKSLKNNKVCSKKALAVYRKIFAVEDEAKEKGMTPDERLRLRKEKTVPVMEEFKKWLDEEVHKAPPKSTMSKAILYTLGRWKALTVFLEDGVVEVSNNLIENVIRPLALGRRNWLFAGSPKGAERLALVYSIILTCKLHGVNSFKYLSDVLRQLPLREAGDIDDLLPWNWADPEDSS